MLARSPAALKKSLSSADGVTSQAADLEGYLGKEGVAVTNLRPSGIALIDGRRLDVVSRGEYIEKNAPIIVSAVTGNQIIVGIIPH
jgi:membrane-bound ClpP family serine protease